MASLVLSGFWQTVPSFMFSFRHQNLLTCYKRSLVTLNLIPYICGVSLEHIRLEILLKSFGAYYFIQVHGKSRQKRKNILTKELLVTLSDQHYIRELPWFFCSGNYFRYWPQRSASIRLSSGGCDMSSSLNDLDLPLMQNAIKLPVSCGS